MTMVDEKLECWDMYFEMLPDGSWGNKLKRFDDIITLDTSDWSPELKAQIADGEKRREGIATG